MEVNVKEYKHCVLVTVTGRVDSATAPNLNEVFEDLLRRGRFKIVVDMSGVEYMSSAGFRVLLSAQRTCRRYHRGEVVLALVPQRVLEALDLAGFTKVFKTFDNLPDAIGYF
ncbi:MAG: STAS domain-containing protein [Anaerolineales bacterium]